MLESKVIFTFDGEDITIQCSKEDKMKDICQKLTNKIQKNINSLMFLYGGEHLNLNLSFKAHVKDKERNEMKVLVYKIDNDVYICPKCGEKNKFSTEKIDDIILSINNLKDTINGAKIIIENAIKNSPNNNINIQLKSAHLILNTLNDDIKKIKEKINNLNVNTEPKDNNNEILNNVINNENINNFIIAEINVNDEDMNRDIRIINSYEECLRNYPDDSWAKDNIYNNEEEIKQCEIKINDEIIPFNYFYKFQSKGKYIIKYLFKNNLKNTNFMFAYCDILTNINLTHFNSNNVTNMKAMFYKCISLTNIDLSNFNTNNVTNMSWMFDGCSSLKKENVKTKDKKILKK